MRRRGVTAAVCLRHADTLAALLEACPPAPASSVRETLNLLLLLLLLLSQDFANMPVEEVRANINSRRDKIFLLMEELRRLRIQQRLKVRVCAVWGKRGLQAWVAVEPVCMPSNHSTHRVCRYGRS